MYSKRHYILNKKHEDKKQSKPEGARESAYLRQVNFYRRPLLTKFLTGHVWTVLGNMHVKSEVSSFNHFGAKKI